MWKQGILLIVNYSLIEVQVFLLMLVGKFKFSMTDKAEWIMQQPLTFLVALMINSEVDHGIQLPLTISLAPQKSEN